MATRPLLSPAAHTNKLICSETKSLPLVGACVWADSLFSDWAPCVAQGTYSLKHSGCVNLNITLKPSETWFPYLRIGGNKAMPAAQMYLRDQTRVVIWQTEFESLWCMLFKLEEAQSYSGHHPCPPAHILVWDSRKQNSKVMRWDLQSCRYCQDQVIPSWEWLGCLGKTNDPSMSPQCWVWNSPSSVESNRGNLSCGCWTTHWSLPARENRGTGVHRAAKLWSTTSTCS